MNRGSTTFMAKFAGNFLQPLSLASPSTVMISLLFISIRKKADTAKQIKFCRNLFASNFTQLTTLILLTHLQH